MAFMEKQSFTGIFYAIETKRLGTIFLPHDVCGLLDGMETGVDYYAPEQTCDYGEPDMLDKEDQARWEQWTAQIADYVGSDIESIMECRGTLYRLSAPGYMDCTDWTTDANSPEFDDE